MRNKARFLICTAILIAGFCFAATGHAQTTVRGQLLRGGQSVVGVQVTLNSPASGRSLPATTGNDGMFYLYNVPFGTYYLEVWASNPPIMYPVQITGYPYNDLPRFSLP